MKDPSPSIYHPDGSPFLSHFIRPRYLLALLCNKAFCLVRQDCQSDPDDGVLPPSTFTEPHHGPLEKTLGANPEFLINQAQAIAGLRKRTFIMCWTCDPAGHMRETYGEHGQRCELLLSENQLKRLIGYEWFPGAEFPPKARAVPEFPGGKTQAELKPTTYSDGIHAAPVIPSAFAAAHKHKKFIAEAELRVEAVIMPEHVLVPAGHDKILWRVSDFNGLAITIGAKVLDTEAAEIRKIAKALGIPVQPSLPCFW